MKMYWRGDGRKVTYYLNDSRIFSPAPIVLDWNHLGNSSTYQLRSIDPYVGVLKEILFLRIPDNGWQETQPKFIDTESLNDA